MSGTLRQLLGVWMSLLTLPPTLLHEVMHAAAAAPVSERVGIVLEPRSLRAECIWEYPDEAEVGALVERFILLCPFLVGLVLGSAVLGVALLNGFALPDSALDLLMWSLGLVWWLVFTAPSGVDLGFVDAGVA